MTAAARSGAGRGGPHRRRRKPRWTPRDFLRDEHGAALASAVGRATASHLVALVVDDDGLLVAGTETKPAPEDIPKQCARMLAIAEPTGAALLVSLDSGFDSTAEAVRRAWLDVRGRFAEVGIELLDWLLVEGDTHVSMVTSRQPGS